MDTLSSHTAYDPLPPRSTMKDTALSRLQSGLKTLGQPIFLCTVLIPTLLAILYFGVFASDVYISESRFVVRSANKSSMSPLGLMLGGSGLSAASEESNAVQEYLGSRLALQEADSDGLLTRAYTAPAIFWLDRFGLGGKHDREHFYEYYLKRVKVENETTTQVVYLTVRAYDAKQAHAINERLLERSEALVNRLSDRARADAVAAAKAEADAAQERARSAARALAAYRNDEGVIDPEKEAAVRLQMISKLQDELLSVRTQLSQLQSYTPEASQIPYLRTQERALQAEIDQQTSGIAGGRKSLSATAARYQELQLDSEIAGKQLATALASLQDARNDASRKRAYVQRIADPSTPDYAMEPRRVIGIFAALLLGLIAWGVLSTLLVGIREHRD
ncbi:hypothetical protein [Novosphingobium sp. KA1]|uniref:hypothetical protein n=1 Tax=Novosphingobium sp. (strain KA1) TaxID=164608 RepID=UPI001F5D06D1|nr:hypothetical protein [Novosphingobium sp. KA1]